jgi:hypothetical protein
MAAPLTLQKPSGRDQKDMAEMKGTELEESRNMHRKVTLFSCVIKVISCYTDMVVLSKVTLATTVPSIAI